jgi:hypothetical protein
MSTLMKRSMLAVMCTGLTASMVIAQSGTPSGTPAVPPMPTKDSVKDHASDAAKKAMEDAKKKAEEAMKGVKDAAHDATKGVPGAAPSPEQQKMMEEMMKSMQPGAMHEWLKKWEGQWDMTVKFYASPSAPPEVSTMTATSTLDMGGRYLIEKVSGNMDMPGMGKVPFEGESVMGYDNLQKKFFTTWRDNMSTGMMFETGTVDGAGKVLTTEGENWNMQANAVTKSKSVATIIDDKNRKLEMWTPGPDGKMMKTMEIEYARK